MMKFLYLIFLLPMFVFAANPRDMYRSCLSSSNKLESPADRDAEKIRCFKQGRQRSIRVCMNLARVLEHTSSADSLVLDCLSENILAISMDSCLQSAKKLHYAENKDKAIWSCLENISIRRSQCKGVTDEMVYPHNRKVALNYCLMKN